VDAYDAVRKNVTDLLSIRRELGASNKITIQTMKMDLTYHDDETINQKLRDLFGDDVVQSITSCTAKGGFSWEDHRLEKEVMLRTSPCRPLLDHLAVLWNGDVTVCCSDFDGRLAIGNVNEKSLQELWVNEQHKKYQRAHLLGQFDSIPLCATCDA
jgi:radical SAM protein with 4Fe4S-binding SPASM domain